MKIGEAKTQAGEGGTRAERLDEDDVDVGVDVDEEVEVDSLGLVMKALKAMKARENHMIISPR